jgi:hypothetical protein
VFFRAPDFGTAKNVLAGMFGLNGTSLALSVMKGQTTSISIVIAIVSVFIAVFMPNSIELTRRFQPTRPRLAASILLLSIGLLFMNSPIPKVFLYFDF